ncbi:hypothetical protein chiPu_0027146 [Chiloscyllium punctatum]|uniref:Uncharacterized protein n=1 Tax=Chiloscyllium punctatum TaxID=137246 RepID=A0A401TJR7_CHIPU|nr:hypothetical protein [Chiloscyllium punctatum]
MQKGAGCIGLNAAREKMCTRRCASGGATALISGGVGAMKRVVVVALGPAPGLGGGGRRADVTAPAGEGRSWRAGRRGDVTSPPRRRGAGRRAIRRHRASRPPT